MEVESFYLSQRGFKLKRNTPVSIPLHEVHLHLDSMLNGVEATLFCLSYHKLDTFNLTLCTTFWTSFFDKYKKYHTRNMREIMRDFSFDIFKLQGNISLLNTDMSTLSIYGSVLTSLGISEQEILIRKNLILMFHLYLSLLVEIHKSRDTVSTNSKLFYFASEINGRSNHLQFIFKTMLPNLVD
jgi:hypothetical protein